MKLGLKWPFCILTGVKSSGEIIKQILQIPDQLVCTTWLPPRDVSYFSESYLELSRFYLGLIDSWAILYQSTKMPKKMCNDLSCS